MDRHLLIRGSSAVIIAITAPIALAKPAQAASDACVSDVNARGAVALLGECCPAPNQYCAESGGGSTFMKFWYEGTPPCPKF